MILGCLAAASARGERFLARETAHVGQRGDYSVGVFAPLTIGVADGLELRAHPLVFLVDPHLTARKRHVQAGSWSLTGEYGFSLPTPLLRLAQGYLFPSWPTSGRQVGWILAPHAGMVASWGDLDQHVLTLTADLAAGIPLSRNHATPLGAPAFLEVELAPALHGFRAHWGALYDRRLSDRFRARVYADVFVHAARPSPFTLRGGAGIDLRVGTMSRFTLGAVWWNSDQHSLDGDGRRVRSNDFLPTLDFIWAG